MDDLIKAYADKLAQVYERRSAGDYTFQGILSEFARKVTAEQEKENGNR